MKVEWCVWHGRGAASGLWLKPGPGLPARRACTVGAAAGILRRSRRQLYRDIKEGSVSSYGKFLGEWLLDLADVRRLSARPPQPQRLPARLQTFFPEHDVSDLNPGRDRHLVLSRLLEHGGPEEIRWARRRFKPAEIAGFIEADGARLLSPRALRFWARFLGIPVPEAPSWRGQAWSARGNP
ncbi:MAG: hypothetical protein HY748_05815 [Elusimicrobia bacterium]|nr:hypothetical protein [Elusimicrobiota bacterium]